MGGRGLTRTMVIWVPDWPVTAAAVATGRSPDEPIVVLEKGKVLATSAAARSEGVRRGPAGPGRAVAVPGAVVLKYDPVIDARAFDPVIACPGGDHAGRAGDPAGHVRVEGARSGAVLRWRGGGGGEVARPAGDVRCAGEPDRDRR